MQRIDIMKRTPRSLHGPFDLVFLDPPYAMEASDVAQFLQRMDVSGALAPSTIAAYEHDVDANRAVLEAFGTLSWDHVKRKIYGDITIDLFRKDQAL